MANFLDRVMYVSVLQDCIPVLDDIHLRLVATIATSLVHAQQVDPSHSVAETPIDTMRSLVETLDDDTRNEIGCVLCAMVNMATSARRSVDDTGDAVLSAINKSHR